MEGRASQMKQQSTAAHLRQVLEAHTKVWLPDDAEAERTVLITRRGGCRTREPEESRHSHHAQGDSVAATRRV